MIEPTGGTKFLILGDHAGTGFGTVTADLGKALLRIGHDVRFISFNEVGLGTDLPEPFKGRTYEIGHDTGWIGIFHTQEQVDAVKARIERMYTGDAWDDGWVADAVIVIGDPASVERSPVIELLPPDMPAFMYIAIEGIELPPRWAALWEGRGAGRLRPVAMAEFGADEIEKITSIRPPVIYHGVDTDTFWPVSPERPLVINVGDGPMILRSKADCRALVSAAIAQTRGERWTRDPQDEVWLFRCDKNVPRKRYPSLFRAVAPVLYSRPSTRLIYHCNTLDQGGNLENDRSKYTPEIAARMLSTGFSDRYSGVGRDMLCAMYNASDIYVSVSAEGFGLTVAEAMACGVPAVGIHFSAVPEVIGRKFEDGPGEGMGGYTVAVGMLMENIYSHWWAGVDEPAYAKQVAWLVDHAKRRRELGWLAARHVARSFTWEACARGFADLAVQRPRLSLVG